MRIDIFNFLLRSRLFQILLGLLLCTQDKLAVSSVQTSNQSPLISLFGFPPPVSSEQKQNAISFRYSLANNFVQKKSNRELLILDGETERFEIGFFYKLNHRFSISANLPFVKHSGGRLDTFVDDWHDFFSLPDTGRPKVPGDRLLYQYRVDGEDLILQTSSESGLGDIRLSGYYSLDTQRTHESAIRAGLKLPTGSTRSLMGSGGADFFLDINRLEKRVNSNWSANAMIGFLIMQDSDQISKQRQLAGYGSTSVKWFITDLVSLDFQITAHSGIVKSSLSELDDPSLQLVLGASLEISKQIKLSFALSEDPVVGASPDVVFHIGLYSQL